MVYYMSATPAHSACQPSELDSQSLTVTASGPGDPRWPARNGFFSWAVSPSPVQYFYVFLPGLSTFGTLPLWRYVESLEVN
jgi:hypothetical protein